MTARSTKPRKNAPRNGRVTGKPKGAPPHIPTDQNRALIKALTGYGIPVDEIGRYVGLHPATIRKHYAEERATGTAHANAKVAESLFQAATSKELTSMRVTACIFWLKTRARWREVSRHELTGKDGGPIQHYDLSKLSDAELDAIERLVRKATPDTGGNPT